MCAIMSVCVCEKDGGFHDSSAQECWCVGGSCEIALAL